jgi:uncharacterized SAM-dependent methyltransferase
MRRTPSTVVPHQAAYEAGLAEAVAGRRGTGRTMTLLLGSNIGNFDPPGADAFLRSVRAALAAGDSLLLGTDLVKPEAALLLAYDDPLGVTAAFNRNLLVRINRELGADFDLDAFHHRAVWNAAESRVEMHLVAASRQQVIIPASSLAGDPRSGRDHLDRELVQVPAGRCHRHPRARRVPADGSVDRRERRVRVDAGRRGVSLESRL